MTFVIGVDGGGTHARAVVVDDAGTELGRGEAPGAVVTARAPAEAAVAVGAAVHEATLAAGVDLPAAVLWAGLSGAGQEYARRAALGELSRAGLADRVIVGMDVEAAFHASFPEGAGVMLIAGTGSIAWARDGEGRVVRAGGWGDRLGDEGSGYWIGMEALRAVVRAEDGRDEPTAMRRPILDALDLDELDELIPWVASASKADVASLVPVIARSAGAGDPAANAVLDAAVEELVGHLSAILERVGGRPGDVRLALWGGLIGRGGTLRSRFLEALASQPVKVVQEEPDPALGAALLALSALHGTESPDA